VYDAINDAPGNVFLIMPLDSAQMEKWKNWVLAALKFFILLGFPLWKLCNLYISGNGSSYIPSSLVMTGYDSPYIPSSFLTTGYLLCLTGLVFFAGMQYGRRQHREALQSLIFFLLGAVFLLVTFEGIPLLEGAIPVTEIVVNGLVFSVALLARRRFKARALTFWIWACVINIAREVGLSFCKFPNWYQASQSRFWQIVNDFPPGDLMDFYWISGFVSSALYVAGIILVIRQLQAKETVRPSPNTAMLVALGVLVLIIELAVSLFKFGKPDFLPVITINLVVILVAVLAIPKYQPAFLCLALAGMFNIGRTFGLDFYHGWSYPPSGFGQGLLESLLTISITASALWATATILIIRRAFVRRCHESLTATPD
jgi:hypothetical protein